MLVQVMYTYTTDHGYLQTWHMVYGQKEMSLYLKVVRMLSRITHVSSLVCESEHRCESYNKLRDNEQKGWRLLNGRSILHLILDPTVRYSHP